MKTARVKNKLHLQIGRRIEELRMQKKLNQEELGELLNLSQEVVSNIEKGLRPPKVEELIIIRGIFNVSADYILTGMK